MKVITGSARGKRLVTLDGEETRPTTERVKEGLFSSIQFEIEGRKVLDLFAGSGQLGIEALSRGAAGAVFVDVSSKATAVIKQNIQSTGVEGATVVSSDSLRFLKQTTEQFDIIFLDPPYDSDLLAKTLPIAFEKVGVGGIVICEHRKNYECPEFERAEIRKYKYGAIALTIYRKTE